jgi:large subunit ribosomal protein L21
MFAVIRTGGKQYRVAAEDVIKVDKVRGDPGEIVQFGEVLVVGGDSITLGQPTIAGASVAAEVIEQGRGPKKPVAAAPAEAGEPDEAKPPKAKAGPKTRARAEPAKKPAKSPAKKPQKPKSGGKT